MNELSKKMGEMNEVLVTQHMLYRKKAYIMMFFFALTAGLFVISESTGVKFATMFIAGVVFNKLLIGISGVRVTFKILKATAGNEEEE